MTVDPGQVYEAILGVRRGEHAVVLVTYRGDWSPYCCGQLVRLAAEAERIHGAGGEVIAISTDGERRQAAMFARWPTPHVRYVADPGGASYLAALGLVDAADDGDRDGVALPAVLVLDPQGEVVYRYVGRDDADRTTDAAVLSALERLSLDPIEPPPGGPVAGADAVDGDVGGDDDGLDGAFAPDVLVPYFEGSGSAAVAIGGRLPDAESRELAREHAEMCQATIDAWSRVGT